MISGHSHRLASALLLAATALLGSGCSSGLDTPGYPKSLRYAARQDLLIKTPSIQQPRVLPPPGRLDESIAKASQEQSVKKYDPQEVSKEHREEIRRALLDVFGTPANPTVEPLDPADLSDGAKKKLSEDKLAQLTEDRQAYAGFLAPALQDAGVKPADIEDLKVDPLTLSHGSRHYRRHCMQCHGLNGDGRGPTGPWVSPHPRDYRQGLFKFVSTSGGNRKPRRADLIRTVTKGIDGTSMPAFGILSANDIEEMVSYVIHLSIRGQVEYDTIEAIIANKGDIDALTGGSVRTHVYDRAAALLANWVDSDHRKPIEPPAYPYEGADQPTLEAAVRNGYQIFIGKKGDCISCHTDFGRQVPYRYDAWGTLVQPRNLTAGNYRGGRRPLDLYWRIAGGIDGSGMSGKTDLDAKGYWDLIHFVQALPYPKMLPEDIRQKVYGDSDKAPVSHASR